MACSAIASSTRITGNSKSPLTAGTAAPIDEQVTIPASRAEAIIAAKRRTVVLVSRTAIGAARQELRRPGTRLIGSVAYFPERYGDELIPPCLDILQNKPTPPAVFVKHQLITSKNVRLIYPLDR
jgi:ribose transport system substrate-binding protein